MHLNILVFLYDWLNASMLQLSDILKAKQSQER